MMNMHSIPCINECVYQMDGHCALSGNAVLGLPALGGACVHFIPEHAAQLGSPHRYCGPESNVALRARADFPPDAPESDIG